LPYKDAQFKHNRQFSPKKCEKGTFRTVDLSHTSYSGEKFDIPGAKAVVCKKKPEGKSRTQSILTPNKENGGSGVRLTKKDQVQMQKFEELSDIINSLNIAKYRKVEGLTFEKWRDEYKNKKFYAIENPPKNDSINAMDFAVWSMIINSYNHWKQIHFENRNPDLQEEEKEMRRIFEMEKNSMESHIENRIKLRREQANNAFERVPIEKRQAWFDARNSGVIVPQLKGKKVVSRMVDSYYEHNPEVEMK